MRIMPVTGLATASRAGEPVVSSVTRGHRIRELDAVRGIAILVVILHNEARNYLPDFVGAHPRQWLDGR